MKTLTALVAELKEKKTGRVLGTNEMTERTFSSGNKGFGVYGKYELAGKVYQISMNIIDITAVSGMSFKERSEKKTAEAVKKAISEFAKANGIKEKTELK